MRRVRGAEVGAAARAAGWARGAAGQAEEEEQVAQDERQEQRKRAGGGREAGATKTKEDGYEICWAG